MKQFAFLALIGAATALSISSQGGEITNPYKKGDPEYKDAKKCLKGKLKKCDKIGMAYPDTAKTNTKDPAPKDPAPKDPAPKDPAPKDPAPKDPAPKDPVPATTDKTPATGKDPAKSGTKGIDCSVSPSGDYKKDMNDIAQKFTYGWIKVRHLPFITQFRGGPDTDWASVDWNAIDYEFNGAIEQEWGNYFRNPEYGYVESSVEVDRFIQYVQDIASQLGRGDDQIWWLVSNMCTQLQDRQERQNKPGYWEAYNDGSTEAWASSRINEQQAEERGYEAGLMDGLNGGRNATNGTDGNGTNSTNGTSSYDSSFDGKMI